MMAVQAESAVEVCTASDGRDKLADRICELYKAREWIEDIASLLGCTRSHVRRVLAERGLKARGRKENPASTERMIAMYEQRKPMREIAEALGCSLPTVFQRLKKAGVERRSASEAVRMSIPTRRKARRASRLDTANDSRIMECYVRVRSMALAAEELGEKLWLVEAVVARNGGGVRAPLSDDLVVDICLRQSRGQSWRQIAFHHRLTIGKVRYAAESRGPALMAARARKAG
jgi:AraC-like DNA-binding protein